MQGLFERYASAMFGACVMHLKRYALEWGIACALLLAASFGTYLWTAPPRSFPANDLYTVSSGTSIRKVADDLYTEHLIAHPVLLRVLLRIAGASVKAGTYNFKEPQNLLAIAYRLAEGHFGIAPVRITFTEGETVREMAGEVAMAFPKISSTDFISAAEPYEGYVFPDTYLFIPDASATTIVTTARQNFLDKITPLASDIQASGHSLSDIVTMASLVEKEARTDTDKHIVAGILWNRIKAGMPLQVDAVFGYIYGRDTYSPSFEDLGVNSPYNTYTHRGLPPGPIDNPGLVSLDAAVHPTESSYLYYLTDKNGVMHYATTYAGHLANERKYLH